MRFIQSIIRGIGQVMFQNNIYSGILFLVGVFFNSWLLGLAALIGTIISTGTAQILGYSKDDIQNGLYGFNGILTGIAVFCFFEVDLVSILALLFGSVLSTLVMRFLKGFIPPFTAPFVVVTWILMNTLLFVFNYPLLPSIEPTEIKLNVVAALSNSFGQVMFQENIVTGLFFLLAIIVNNKLMAIYAIYAAALGSLFGWFISDISTVNSGLMGYNAILCAIALTGNKRSDFLWITVAILISTLSNIGLKTMGLITLTAPFVLSTWIVLIFKKYDRK